MSESNLKIKDVRKRRSFYEPEAQYMIDWLNDQSDLGTSLRLLIVDAMQKYGKGDVVQAYLERRGDNFEQALHAGEHLITGEIGSGKEVLHDVLVSHMPVAQPFVPQTSLENHTFTGMPVKPTTIHGSDSHELQDEPPKQPKEQDEQVEIDMLAHAQQASPEARPLADDVEYDPIAVMMADSGSAMK